MGRKKRDEAADALWNGFDPAPIHDAHDKPEDLEEMTADELDAFSDEE
jgi:hypothetical protein